MPNPSSSNDNFLLHPAVLAIVDMKERYEAQGEGFLTADALNTLQRIAVTIGDGATPQSIAGLVCAAAKHNDRGHLFASWLCRLLEHQDLKPSYFDSKVEGNLILAVLA